MANKKVKSEITNALHERRVVKQSTGSLIRGVYTTYYGQLLFFDGTTLWLYKKKGAEASKVKVTVLANGQFEYRTRFCSHKRSLFYIPPDLEDSSLADIPFLKDKGKTFQDIATLGGYSILLTGIVIVAVAAIPLSGGGSLSLLGNLGGHSFGTPSINEEDETS